MKTRPTVLFLYTEIAEYFLSACEQLAETCDVVVVRWPVNNEAPFLFQEDGKVVLLDRNKLQGNSLLQKIKSIQPDVIFCSGWLDKGYLDVVKSYAGKIPTVISLDNHWKGSLKQRVTSLGARFSFLKNFDYAWVPGEEQFKYALKLGFKEQDIFTGYYTANLSRYNQVFAGQLSNKKVNYPKQFLYLGRYVEHKGIFDLWEAYAKYRQKGGQWNLLCAGTGDQWENRKLIEGLEHIGFVQPDHIPELLEKTGCYILPSHFEPWGVSVHEMAAAGMPLLLSSEVGSKSQFLKHAENGYLFQSGSAQEIENCLFQIEKKEDAELVKMTQLSHELGNTITTEQWVNTVLTILNKS